MEKVSATQDIKNRTRDFTGGPLVKPSLSKAGGVRVQPLVSELRFPHASQPKKTTQNKSSMVTNSIKTLKIVHIKKKKNLNEQESRMDTENGVWCGGCSLGPGG